MPVVVGVTIGVKAPKGLKPTLSLSLPLLIELPLDRLGPLPPAAATAGVVAPSVWPSISQKTVEPGRELRLDRDRIEDALRETAGEGGAGRVDDSECRWSLPSPPLLPVLVAVEAVEAVEYVDWVEWVEWVEWVDKAGDGLGSARPAVIVIMLVLGGGDVGEEGVGGMGISLRDIRCCWTGLAVEMIMGKVPADFGRDIPSTEAAAAAAAEYKDEPKSRAESDADVDVAGTDVGLVDDLDADTVTSAGASAGVDADAGADSSIELGLDP